MADEMFEAIRYQIGQFDDVVWESNKSKERQWMDDSEVLKAYVTALSATKAVLKSEQEQVKGKLEGPKKRGKSKSSISPQNFLTKSEVQEKLDLFRVRIREAENRVQQALDNLNSAVRSEERCMLEDQIAILRETRKLCLEEAKVLEVVLNEMEVAEETYKAHKSEWEELRKLNEQLVKLESKIDQAKRCLLFPSVQGYRFRVGSGGIYVGAKDLYLSDLSGSFSLSVEEAKKEDKVAVVKMHMGGREARPSPSLISETDRSDVSVDDEVTDLNNGPVSPQGSLCSEGRAEKSEPRDDHSVSSCCAGDPLGATSVVTYMERDGQETESEIREDDSVLQEIEGKSAGSRFAMKFLKKISDKSQSGGNRILRFGRKHFGPSQAVDISGNPSTLMKRFIAEGSAEAQSEAGQKPIKPPHRHHLSGIATYKTKIHDFVRLDEVSSVSRGQEGHEAVHLNGNSVNSFEQRSECPSDVTSLVGAGRRGVHIKLQGTHVNLVGEKGTRVPNFTVREITLEVECLLSVTLEFTEKHGWRCPDGLKLEIIQLRKKAVGNSIPLPAGLVKVLLNLILPKTVEKALLTGLPEELGIYILESARGAMAAGEVIVAGPPLCTTQARVNTRSPHTNPKSRATDIKAYTAVQEAQSLLCLTSDQAALLGECFSRGKWGLLDDRNGWTGECTISELCRFYDRYSKADSWYAMCDLWTKATRHVASLEGLSCSLDFSALMNGPVARLAAKPVRTQCLFTRLNCELDVDVFLLALRDYCERSAREMNAEKPMAMEIPLEDQLKALWEWYSFLRRRLNGFKSNFKSLMAEVVAKADWQSFQIGLERALYEGPLNLEVPVVESQEEGLMSFDVSVPAMPSEGSSSSNLILETAARVLKSIRYFQDIRTDSSGTKEGEDRRLEWGMSSSTVDRLAKARTVNETQSEKTKRPLSLGKAFIRHLETSICLNPNSLADHIMKESNGVLSPDSLMSTLSKLQDVLTGGLQYNPDNNSYSLVLRSGDHSRLRCNLSSLGFQSKVSPAEIASMAYIGAIEWLEAFDQSSRAKTVDRLLKQVIMYLDKRSLDVLMCSNLQSSIFDGHLVVSLSEVNSSENGIRYPIQLTNDFDIICLMKSLSLAQGRFEA